MNKKCFRVIFSKTLQRLVVTSELAKSEGKSNEASDGFSLPSLQLFAQLRPLTFNFFCALGFVAFSDNALAETLIIQADKSAPKNQQPIILQTANGLPQVNIQTPNEKGLSHNKYSKFDVDTKGAILNNSRKNSQTQQAGWVQGNPYLARGEAKVILNEVNSNDPSVLKGYVEVAGKKADVIIANPSGLHCDGCGIINSDRVTLTTGKPHIQNGNLDSFVVEKGKVNVSGKGLDNSRVDYTDILAREVQANAGIWSKKETKIITGKNTIKRSDADKNLQIIHTNQPLAEEAKPQFAVDVGELGGMYSGKIHLIGTENGVGVRNAGHIGASAETLKIDSQGRIINTGTLNSHQALDLTATKGIENKGKIENRQENIKLTSQQDIKQDGSIVARQGNIHKQAAKAITQQGESVAKGDIRYTAASVNASTRSLIAAGVNVKDSNKGEIRELDTQSAQGDSIQITTANKATLQGKNIASGKVQVQANEVNLDNSQNSAHTIEVKASKGKIQANGATIIANREIKLTTPTLLETQNSHLKAEKLTTKQRSLNIKNATWEQTGKDELVLNVVDTLQNSGGTFSTQGDFTVKANGIDNQGGRLLAQGKIAIDAAQGKVDSSGGVVYSPKTINILSGELVNNSGLIQSGQNITLNTQGKGLSNNNTLTDNQSKGIVALGALQIHSANLVNQQGRIVSGGQQQLNTEDLNNQQGLIYTQEALSLNSANIKNDKGQIKAAKQADLVISDDLSQQNGVVEADVLNLSAHNIDSRDESQIVANRTTISVENQLVNSNSLIQADKEALTLQAARLDNTKGRMIAKKAQLDLKVRVQFNNLQGSVWTNNKLNMNVGKFNNQQGTLHSEQDLNLTATQLENNQGTISSNTNSSLKIKNAMSQEAGHILSSGVLSIHADQLHSTNKSVISGNQVNVATGQMVNKASQLLAKQAMTISSQALDNTQGEISSQHNAVTIDTHQQKLDNTQGKIRSKLALSIQSGELDNSQGVVHSESDILLNTHQQKLINQHTLSVEKGIIALGQLTLQGGVFNNQQGYLASRLDQFLTVSDLNNTQGLIKASQKLKLTAEDIQNHEGLISAKTVANISVANQFMQRNGQLGADELTLNTARLSNEQGSLIAATSANIQIAGQLSNTQSRINTVNDLIIKSQQLNNSLGVINSRDGNMDIHTQQHQLDNTKGHMTAKGNLTLSAGELTNQQGYIQSQQQATIDLGSSALQNQNGTLSTDADLRLTAGTIHNGNGKIAAKQHINADIANLYQHNGTVKAEQQLNLSASGEILSKNHSQLIGENLNIRTNGQLDNQQSEIVAQQSVTLRSAKLNNNNGVLIAEQGNLEIDTQQQSLTNQQGKLSAGANLTLNSGLLDNQQGLIQSRQNMMINTHQGNLNNQQTKIDPQRKQNQGIIALGELVLTTQQLLNQQGYLLSKGQQTLNTQSIENGEGVIASLANQNISVSQHIGNVLGRISGNASTLKAQSVDNQSGLLQGEHSLNVKVTETLNNQNGQIKADELLDAKAKIIHNREGQMRAVNGALSLSSQQKLDNRLGNISAKSQAMIKAKGINNQQGLIYNEQGGLELNLQQQALENQQGNVIAKATLNVESGAITNYNGAIYAERLGTLKVDGVVDNQYNGKIHGLGEMQIQANQIDNRGGEIRTQNKLTLDVATDINNQKVSGMGSFIESGDKLIINAAQINNSQTKSNTEKMHQGILASHLTISAQSLNNQRGKIHSQETSNFVIQQNLDNRQGDVTGSGSVSITGEQSNLNNQDGRLQADTLLVISANEVTTNGHIEGQDVQIRQKQDFVTGQHINADRSLAITTEGNLTNRHHLYADESVTLNAQHISNQVDARISSANTQLNAKGNLTNEGLINSISPEDNAKTVIKVGGTLLNTGKGRIYGDDIALQADRIENSDKDYGNGEIKSAVVATRGRLDLAAREMDNNTAHYLSDNQIGATLFSVGNMTFGRTLNAENRAEGKAEILRNNSSLIESERHIALNVAQVTNSNPHLIVHHLINGKEGDEITRIKGSEKTINQEYIIPYNGQNLPAAFENQKGAEKGSLSAENDTYISMKNLVWVSWSRAGQLVYNLNNVEPTLLKAGDQITEDMLLASRNQMRCDGYESSTSHCHYIPAGQYEIDSPIWAYANATPPTKSSPVFSFDDLAAQPWYKEDEWFSVDPKTKELDQFIAPPKPIEPTQPIRGATETDNDFQARTESYQQALVNYHQAKEKWDFYQTKIKPYNDWVTENAEAIEKIDEKILAHNQALRQKLGQAYFRNFWLIKLKQSQEDESKVIQTLPGQILAAGNLTFDGNRLINDRSTVIAGEKLNLIGTVENRDQEGLHRLTESGSSQYTKERWRGGFKRYHQREWGRVNDYKRIIETPFDMHVYRFEDKVNYVQNSRISEEMKQKTHHSLTLTNVDTTTDALRATANQGLGELNGTLSGDFAELTSSERDIDHIDTQDIKGQEVHTTNVKEKLTAFQDVRASRLNGLASSGIAPQNEIKAPKTTTTRPLERLVLNDNQEVRSIEPNVVIPQNVLYRVNAEPDSKVLIETDPDFTDKRRWLSSDYMFNALRYEPNATQKRLGDGFYEQRLVREQINRLTGRQFLGNSRDFDSQYKALMDAGISFAQKFNLRPGIALSSAQVAQLTSDIVWFEKQMVTLPDGNQSAVLVPRVYALVKKGDITSNGSLLSGSHVYHQGGEFINSGTVSGRALVQFDSDSIRNTGNISGGAVVGKVRGHVENIGGTIEADRAILLDIAGDFTHRSTTHTTEVNEKGYQRRDTTLGRKGLLYVKGEEGVLQLSANNINLAGAGIINDGKGQTSLSAKSQLNLSALSVGFDEKMGKGNHYRNEKVQGVAISHIQGKGDVVLSGRDIYSEGAEVDAKGRLALLAENEIVLGTASQQREYEEYHKTKSGSALSRKNTTTYDEVRELQHKGTEMTGDTILVKSGRDIIGESLLAVSKTGDVDFIAGNNVSLTSATNLLSEKHIKETKRSGLLNGGEIGFTIGSQKTRQESSLDGALQSNARNTLASEQGNVRVQAGNKAFASNIDVIVAKDKKATLSGKHGSRIEGGKDIIDSTDKYEFSQSGLSIALSTPVTDAVQSARTAIQQSKATKNDKLKGVYAVKAAEEVAIAAQNAQKVADTLGQLGKGMEQNAAVAENPAVKISVSLGTQKQTRESESRSVTHLKSRFDAGNVDIISEDGKVELEGVDAKVADTLLLEGKKGIVSKGVMDTQDNKTTNKNHSASVGVFVGFNGDSYGIGIEASASLGKGKENSHSEIWQNNQFQTGKFITRSDGKLTLDSTNVKAERWEGDVQDLELISRQDVMKYKSEHAQAGGSVSVTYGSGGGANFNAAYNSAKLNTAQVENQTSVDVGKGGMDVVVKGNTHLEGAVISSHAEKADNRFQTGTLTTKDIQNHSELKTKSVAISGGSSGINPMSTLSLLGNKNESSQSTTHSAVGENIHLTLTNDPNAETTLKQLNRETENANQKVTKQDLTKVKETQELVKGIGEIADKAMQIYTHNEREKIEQAKLELGRAKAQNASEEEITQLNNKLSDLQKAYDKEYGTGSPTKRAVDAITAALQGLAAKDGRQALVGLASPYVNEQIKKYTGDNKQANLIAHALLGAVEAQITGNNALAGAVAGAGSEAAAMALKNTLYSDKPIDQLSESEKQKITFLSQLAGGLAAGVVGDSAQSAAIGADIGKRAVENNFFDVVVNNPQVDWLGMAEGERVKQVVDEEIAEETKDIADKYLPHYVTIGGELYYVSAKGVLNLRNGDVFVGGSFSPVILPSRGIGVSASLGWAINLERKNTLGERVTAQRLSNDVISGTSVNISACYYGCIGYGQSISTNSKDKVYRTVEIGIGAGLKGNIQGASGSISEDKIIKIGD
ncbi:filamentous hemagglutinin N-terminal domain-containing protein [[Haemophilus] felis]|nr:filamentous hemagglutinin N-terminal domain-containing protein [[Haemophilus] felis]